VSNETEIKQTVATIALIAATKCTKLVFGRILPRTSLGELTTLPQTPSWWPRVCRKCVCGRAWSRFA